MGSVGNLLTAIEDSAVGKISSVDQEEQAGGEGQDHAGKRFTFSVTSRPGTSEAGRRKVAGCSCLFEVEVLMGLQDRADELHFVPSASDYQVASPILKIAVLSILCICDADLDCCAGNITPRGSDM